MPCFAQLLDWFVPHQQTRGGGGRGAAAGSPWRRAGEKRSFARPEQLGCEAGAHNFSVEKYV